MSEVRRAWYINADIILDRTPSGLMAATGLDVYQGARLRDKVVFRVDILKSLNRVVSKETLSVPAARNVFWKMISGQLQQQTQVSRVLNMLYEQDELFRLFLGGIYYFTLPCSNSSFYEEIMVELLKQFNGKESEIVKVMEGQGVKILYSVNGYIYCSLTDMDVKIKTPEYCTIERLSHAKSWRG